MLIIANKISYVEIIPRKKKSFDCFTYTQPFLEGNTPLIFT